MVWLGQAMAPDSPLYNMVWRIDLTGELDERRFKKAWLQVVAATDTLRTQFFENNGEPVQIVSDLAGQLPVEDLRNEIDPEKLVAERISADSTRPLDLTKGTYRTVLFRLRDDQWVWYLNQHHISTDAGSGHALWKRLISAYQDEALNGCPLFESYVRMERGEQAIQAARAKRERVEAQFANRSVGRGIKGKPANRQLNANVSLDLRLGKERIRALKILAGTGPFASLNADFSFFILLTTAIGAFIARQKGEQEISIGAPAHNRRTQDLRDTAGFLVEVLPIAISIAQDDSLNTLGRKTKAECIRWMKDSGPGVVSPTLLNATSTVINFMPLVFDAFPNCRQSVQWLPTGAHDSNQELRLNIFDFDGTGDPIFRFEVKAEIADEGTTAALAEQFTEFLDNVIHSPDMPLSGIAMLSPDSHFASIASGPQTPEPQTVLTRFLKMAARKPNAVALSHGGQTTTFSELALSANGIATALASAGIGKNDAVAIHTARSAEFVAAVLGTWIAGGFFTPLPKNTPPERLKAVLRQLAPKVVLGDARRIAIAEDVVQLDIAAIQPLSTFPDVTSEGLAYVLFTSGSTGVPKGVQVSAPAIARYVDWAAKSYGPSGATSYAFCSSIGFDLTLTSLFVPLVTGGTIFIYDEPHTGPDLAVLEAIEDDRADVVKLTPSHLSLAVHAGHAVSNISTLILGGENLTTASCRQARAVLGEHLVIANEYGPTEAVVGCMIHVFDAQKDSANSVPIGGPADDTTLAVLDSAGHPVPFGVPGELAISGDRLADGYFRDPEMTNKSFRTDNTWNGKTNYMTGDLVCLTDEGTFQYLGRFDEQVKISGVRIEPAEVSSALLAQPGITQAVALPFGGEAIQPAGKSSSGTDGGTKLSMIAYVVANAPIDEPRLIGNLRRHLAPELVPSHIIQLEELPVTANGKVATDRLPKPEANKSPRLTHVQALPKTDTERHLAQIFSEVIGLEAVDVEQNFYDLGGDSISAIQIAMLGNEQGLALRPNSVFEFQTIRSLAAALGATDGSKDIDLDDDGPLVDFDEDELEALRLAGISGTRSRVS
jgi:amino acid adenylation domain-containing protein